jgi:hypothetical protein
MVRRKQITLNLNSNQASVLEALLSATGGSPETSPRKYADEVLDMLHEANVYSKFQADTRVGFYFADFTGGRKRKKKPKRTLRTPNL